MFFTYISPPNAGSMLCNKLAGCQKNRSDSVRSFRETLFTSMKNINEMSLQNRGQNAFLLLEWLLITISTKKKEEDWTFPYSFSKDFWKTWPGNFPGFLRGINGNFIRIARGAASIKPRDSVPTRPAQSGANADILFCNATSSEV